MEYTLNHDYLLTIKQRIANLKTPVRKKLFKYLHRYAISNMYDEYNNFILTNVPIHVILVIKDYLDMLPTET